MPNLLGGEERFENTRANFGPNATAHVRNRQPHARSLVWARVMSRDAHAQLATLGHRVARVHDQVHQRLFDLQGKFGAIARHSNLPASMVIIQRINLGLYSVLASLGATANWRRIAEEIWPSVRGPASTVLGQEEEAWLASHASAD